MGKVGQSRAYGVLRMESRVKVGMENRKKGNGYEARVSGMNMGQGGAGIGVLVRCCTECNITLPCIHVVKCWDSNSMG